MASIKSTCTRVKNDVSHELRAALAVLATNRVFTRVAASVGQLPEYDVVKIGVRSSHDSISTLIGFVNANSKEDPRRTFASHDLHVCAVAHSNNCCDSAVSNNNDTRIVDLSVTT